ncbi:hypothetical protein JOB18_010737 [Solea senegalensis]|uniref:Uncharacterized protein n=1 Tax=Solea senegalensis TaxID=28829 RepID=A0AAV6RMJ5_SOLSE|nr:hypothetical protein JOB18_010737 [Solea senegalensis]
MTPDESLPSQLKLKVRRRIIFSQILVQLSERRRNDPSECPSLDSQTCCLVAEGRGLLRVCGLAVQQAPTGRHQPARPQRI